MKTVCFHPEDDLRCPQCVKPLLTPSLNLPDCYAGNSEDGMPPSTAALWDAGPLEGHGGVKSRRPTQHPAGSWSIGIFQDPTVL